MFYTLVNKKPKKCKDALTWAKSFEKNRHVAYKKVGNFIVSTVFMGVSIGTGVAVLFETAVFHKKGKKITEVIITKERTYANAMKTHESMVSLVRGVMGTSGADKLRRIKGILNIDCELNNE